jgi:hypothetical protein
LFWRWRGREKVGRFGTAGGEVGGYGSVRALEEDVVVQDERLLKARGSREGGESAVGKRVSGMGDSGEDGKTHCRVR